MGYYFEINGREYNSKVTAGLMGTIIHTVIGPRDEILDGWALGTKHMALIISNMANLSDKESLNRFMELHKDSYWATQMSKSPDLYKDTVSHVRDAFAEALANMILDGTNVVLATWT